jgi:hypothetical protein
MSETTPPNHDDRGKFVKGNRVNAGGNPTSRSRRVRMKISREAAERMLRNECELIKSMVESVSAKAREGDLRSINKLEDWLTAGEKNLADDVAEIRRQMKAAIGGGK